MQTSPSEGVSQSAQAPSVATPAPYWLLFSFALIVADCMLRHQEFAHRWMEDLPVYARAVANFQARRNPYDPAMAPLYFLYPPFFLYVANFLSVLVPAGWGKGLYEALHVATTFALPVVLGRYFFRQSAVFPWLTPLFALLLFFATPLITGVLALFGGNIASTLYCLAFAGAVPGLRRGIWRWFYIAVFLAAMVKVTFLVLLLLPLLAGKKQWVWSILCGGLVVAGNLLEMKLLPDLYGGYRWSLAHGIIGEGTYGYGVFGIVAAYGYKAHIPTSIGPYAAAGLTAVTLLTLMFWMRKRLETLGNLQKNGVWLALIVATIILVNPREMDYDVDISLFAAFLLWVYVLDAAVRGWRLLALMMALFLPCLLVPLVVKAPHLYGMYGTLESLLAFALAYRRLGRELDSAAVDAAIATGIA